LAAISSLSTAALLDIERRHVEEVWIAGLGHLGREVVRFGGDYAHHVHAALDRRLHLRHRDSSAKLAAWYENLYLREFRFAPHSRSAAIQTLTVLMSW
jgi:hypothetical protein